MIAAGFIFMGFLYVCCIASAVRPGSDERRLLRRWKGNR